jgi:hypothetical protein
MLLCRSKAFTHAPKIACYFVKRSGLGYGCEQLVAALTGVSEEMQNEKEYNHMVRMRHAIASLVIVLGVKPTILSGAL